MRKVIVWFVVVAGLAGAGYGGWRYFGARKDSGPKFVTTPVDKGNIVARVTASGTLSALVTVQVGSQVSGRIAEIHTDFNAEVKKDEVIARIDPLLFEAAVEQARANLFADQSNLTKAKIQAEDSVRQYTRAKALIDQKLIAQADVDTAQATADAARANIAAAQGQVARSKAALSSAEVNLKFTVITSPINGVVISRNVDVGQTVASALQAPTLFTIAEDLKKMQVDTSVAEADVGKLAKDMSATFTVDAFPGERFRGTVRQIRNAAITVSNVVTYDAVIDVENPDLKLRPGMTANVTFIYAEKRDALRVPNAALRFRMPPTALASAPAPASGPSRTPATPAGPGPSSAPAGGPSSAPATADGAAGGTRPGGFGGRRQGGMAPGASDKKQVWVWRDPLQDPVQVSIKAGVTDGSFTEVAEGDLKEGDPVITEAPNEPSAAPAQGPGGPGGRRLF